MRMSKYLVLLGLVSGCVPLNYARVDGLMVVSDSNQKLHMAEQKAEEINLISEQYLTAHQMVVDAIEAAKVCIASPTCSDFADKMEAAQSTPKLLAPRRLGIMMMMSRAMDAMPRIEALAKALGVDKQAEWKDGMVRYHEITDKMSTALTDTDDKPLKEAIEEMGPLSSKMMEILEKATVKGKIKELEEDE